ncbi:D-2-hydroxyacid dehydrogenase family protein [Candidatus Puniceispirillum sp.]|nr:D-2-hydroxyacid dehydrogenase family protein [Candidatus Puniceispirillum sp.]
MKIAILDDWLNCAKQSANWDNLGNEVQVDFFKDTVNDKQLIQRLLPYQIICLMRERTDFNAKLMEQLPNLQGIVTSGMRNAAIDLAASKAREIVVSGTTSPGHATAELAFILVGAMARALLPNAHSMLNGGWQTHLGRDLRGANLGILGLGRLGAEVAHFGKAFGMNVQAWSQNLTNSRCQEIDVNYADKETFFKTSDFISIHLKLSDRVRHLIGVNELNMMQTSAYLVNTSRAAIIDMNALTAALKTQQIAGAAIDVYDLEPLPIRDPVRKMPNLLMTPHIGYVTRETMEVFYGQTVEAIQAIISGNPIRQLNA